MGLKNLLMKCSDLKPGDAAPDFTLPSQTGAPIRLSDYFGKKSIVLYFYPKDDTYGCIAESCSFRDSYEVFTGAGAEVIGISSDSPASHVAFAQKYQLPFILLSDQANEVRKLYKVPSTMGVIPGRVTFIINKKGKICHVFSSQFSPKSHVDEALRILKDNDRKCAEEA